jgi:hypothetical protein
MLSWETISACSENCKNDIKAMCGQKLEFLGAFAKLRKATVNFVTPVRLSVRPRGATRLPLVGFSLNLIFKYFLENLLRKFKFSLQSDKNNMCLYEGQYTFLIISRWILLRNRNVSEKTCRANQCTHFMYNNFFLIVPFVRYCGKILYSRADHSMRVAYWILSLQTHTQNV